METRRPSCAVQSIIMRASSEGICVSERNAVKGFRLKMSEKRLSVGINVSILVILTIFGVLLSLPLRLLLDTNYYTQSRISSGNETNKTADNSTASEIIVIPIDHRKLRRCPKFEYEERLRSVFRSDYDGNCTYVRPYVTSNLEGSDEEDGEKAPNGEEAAARRTRETVGENLTENADGSAKNRRMKSVPVAVHILVTMLVILAIAAFVEALRIYFTKLKDSSRADSADSRKGSIMDNPAQRRFIPRQPMKSQRSFEVQGMHRSALRLLGARPPPLIRRSSFPTQLAKPSVVSIGGTPNNRMSRRQSAESDEEVPALHHRTHLIRRH